ncbi:MAG: hypothetical protein ACPGVN_08365, partial [Alphaproteobacteria bacterium]
NCMIELRNATAVENFKLLPSLPYTCIIIKNGETLTPICRKLSIASHLPLVSAYARISAIFRGD